MVKICSSWIARFTIWHAFVLETFHDEVKHLNKYLPYLCAGDQAMPSFWQPSGMKSKQTPMSPCICTGTPTSTCLCAGKKSLTCLCAGTQSLQRLCAGTKLLAMPLCWSTSRMKQNEHQRCHAFVLECNSCHAFVLGQKRYDESII